MKQLTTLKWLLKREIWENKAMLFWSNLVLGGLILFTVPFFFRMSIATSNLDYFHDFQKERLLEMSSSYFSGGVTLFSILMVAVMYSYATSCMSDERKDRSIFFWKSLPISDELTVVSKLITALISFPLMVMVAFTATTLISMFTIWIVFVIHGVNLFSQIFFDMDIWGKFWNIFSWFPIYVAWALPTVGWLMLVSAWVRKRAGMWAILIPVGISISVTILNGVGSLGLDVHRISYILFFRGLCGIIPSNLISNFYVNPTDQSVAATAIRLASKTDLVNWDVVASPDLWLGVFVGGLMLFSAARIRRSRDD
ncbi:hypothetical protein ACO0K7_13625 [Undibacterium sp. Ji67W]|uniref:hypothetical protein n=1 Tax=Undibacterium sp. Ji67W TaxID=3413042 RepID=UPI003BF33E52